ATLLRPIALTAHDEEVPRLDGHGALWAVGGAENLANHWPGGAAHVQHEDRRVALAGHEGVRRTAEDARPAAFRLDAAIARARVGIGSRSEGGQLERVAAVVDAFTGEAVDAEAASARVDAAKGAVRGVAFVGGDDMLAIRQDARAVGLRLAGERTHELEAAVVDQIRPRVLTHASVDVAYELGALDIQDCK